MLEPLFDALLKKGTLERKGEDYYHKGQKASAEAQPQVKRGKKSGAKKRS